jgi:hypothetical protein
MQSAVCPETSPRNRSAPDMARPGQRGYARGTHPLASDCILYWRDTGAPMMPTWLTWSHGVARRVGRPDQGSTRSGSPAERRRKANQEADRAEAEAWSIRMEGYGGPAQPSPTIGQCLNGGYA